MALGFEPQFNSNIIKGAMQIAIERAMSKTSDFMIEVGRSFNQYVQANKGYQNITHSLISSTGFAVFVNGDLVHEEFIDGGNAQGKAKGQRVAKENIESKGVQLVCVAGESYASLVESKGKDVITGSSQEVSDILKKVLRI